MTCYFKDIGVTPLGLYRINMIVFKNNFYSQSNKSKIVGLYLVDPPTIHQ